MIGEALGEIAGWFVRTIVIDVILEIIIKGPGYVLVRAFSKSEGFTPDGIKVLLVGVLFWAMLGGVGYGLYRMVR